MPWCLRSRRRRKRRPARRSASARSTCRTGSIPTRGIRRPPARTSSSSRSCSRSKAFRDQLVTVSKMKAPWGESVHLGASSAFLNGTGPVGVARRLGRRVRQDPVEEDDRSVHRRRRRRRHAAALDRSRHRGHGHRRRRLRRLPLHVLQRALVARRLQPAADRHQPARHLRADVRRDRLDRAAHGAAEGEAEPARLGDAGNREAAALARRARPRHPRRVSEQHPPGRAAARSHGDPARHDHRHRRKRRSGCPRRSTIT